MSNEDRLQRLHVPVEAGPTALPEFKDRETWLIQVGLQDL